MEERVVNEIVDSSVDTPPVENGAGFTTQQLQLLVDCVPTGAMLVNTAGDIVRVNQNLSETLGYSPQELIQNPIETLLPERYRHHHLSLMGNYFKSPRKRQMGKGQELYALKADGAEIPIEIGLNPIQTEGGELVLATVIDISSRHQADHLFRQSISVAPHGVLVINEHGRIEMVNDQAWGCLGYTEDELLGQTVEMLLPERYRGDHLNLRQSYNSEPSVRMMGPGRDLTALHKDGSEFPVEIGLSPFKDMQQRPMVMVSMVDITERKRMEIELRETNTSLEEFTYVASHDLRSPLRGIGDLLQWVEEDLGGHASGEVQHNLDRIKIRVHRMEQLIDNLLTYARAGQVETETELVTISDLLDDILDMNPLPPSFMQMRDLQTNTLMAARTPLETVLRNIIGNAVKHHDKPQGVIKISTMAENNLCHFIITDDGPGIPEQAIDRVFRLFQTLTSTQREGTGIGLSICRRLVESNGGQISVELNTSQRGVSFHVWWPRFTRKDTHD